MTTRYVQVDRFPSADEAILATDEARARAQGFGESNGSLRARLEQLEAQRQSIEAEIHQIEMKLALDQRLGKGPCEIDPDLDDD